MAAGFVAEGAPLVRVLAEEDVYTLEPPNNGAGPLWCYGCSVVVRNGDDVYASQMETGEGVPRLCNTRWLLLKRGAEGWNTIAEAEGYRQREPCPVGINRDNTLFLYVNDSITPAGTEYGPCVPNIRAYALNGADYPVRKFDPVWDRETYFTDHSYRGFAVDADANELLMLNIDAKTSIQHWSRLDGDGKTIGNGAITFPIRSCYPQVALDKGSGHVLAISDIVEPVAEWREYKFEQTQRKWDYVFRILYYAWSPDLATNDFSEPIAIADVDNTGGAISNQDLWIAPNGDAYVLYTQREVQSALLRDKFFPDKSIINALHLAVVREGAVVERRTLIEGTDKMQPGHARLHETPNGAVYAVISVSGNPSGNYLLRVYPEDPGHTLTPIPLEYAFGSYCLASVRAGNAPSNTIDIFGHRGSGRTLSYAQVAIGN
jgi:hypothetical protein